MTLFLRAHHAHDDESVNVLAVWRVDPSQPDRLAPVIKNEDYSFHDPNWSPNAGIVVSSRRAIDPSPGHSKLVVVMRQTDADPILETMTFNGSSVGDIETVQWPKSQGVVGPPAWGSR